MRQFAEDEIICPEGPYAGQRFRCDVQPWTSLWFDQVESSRFNRFAATGPRQSGKTLCCYIIPGMYHLFELGEKVICLVPKMEMAYDKWQQDFEPAIRASRYADLLPTRGKGSRGGSFESITFGNGATLKFMSGGGGDKSRVGYTARVVLVTEADGMDEASETSRETDPIGQAEECTAAFGENKRIYIECTVSTTTGRIWQEYKNGSESRIMVPCPHCGARVSPEREHFLGWNDAETEIDAEEKAAFFCPECATAWTERQRIEANQSAKLIHRGQQIATDGAVTGETPGTRTLGFRWNAFNNLFATCRRLGGVEWRADPKRVVDEDNQQKSLHQFFWAIPHDGDVTTVTDLSAANIMSRMSDLPRGILPDALQGVTVGVDVGKYLLHWTAKAWSNHPTGYTIDYGVVEVHSRDFGEEAGVFQALRQLRGKLMSGWEHHGAPVVPLCILVDSGYCADSVYKFCGESGLPFMPTKGLGYSQYQGWKYGKPTSTGQKIRWIGDGCHVSRIAADVELVEIDADFWKTRTHSRLECEPHEPGAIQLYKAENPREHFTYAKHLTAEKKVEEFIAGRGLIVRWEKMRKANHYLDTESLANVAGHLVEIEVVRLAPAESKKHRIAAEMRPDGRSWL